MNLFFLLHSLSSPLFSFNEKLSTSQWIYIFYLSCTSVLAFPLQRQRLINSRGYANGESEVSIKIPIKHAVENGTGPGNSTERNANGTRKDEDVAEAGHETENENEDNENNENDEEEEEEDDDNDGPFTPFEIPCKSLYF